MKGILTWATLVAGSVGAAGSLGCASTRALGTATVGFAREGAPSMQVEGEQVVATRINPMVPFRLSPEGEAVAVTFRPVGRRGEVAKIDAGSLRVLSQEATGLSESPAAPSTEASRVALDDGRFVVCWARLNADGGRQAMAQMWAADGSPVGGPVVVSPPDVDVFGAPRAVSTDGRHVVVAFASTSGSSFELRAATLRGGERSGSDVMAWR